MDSIFELGVLYYIMDAARNLYKINFQDQLVVTCDINKASDMKVKDELAEKLKKEAMNAIIEFDKYSRIIERKKLLDLL